MTKKKKYVSVPEQILKLLKKKKVAMKKVNIARALNMRIQSVNYGCRVLRKKKIVGMYLRTYWGLR